MNPLDMGTVIISYGISNLICMIIMIALWRQNRQQFSGIGFWLINFIMQFVALVLLALHGVVPDFLSMTVSDAMVIGGAMLLYTGMEQFTGKRGSQTHNYVLLAAFSAIHAYFVFVFPSPVARNILFSLALLIVFSQCAWLMLRRAAAETQVITRGTGWVFIVFCLISIAHLAVVLIAPPGNDFFRSGDYDTFLMITYQMLFIILTLNLFLMVNRRLVVELEDDVAARKGVEKALRESEEQYQAFISQCFEAVYRTEFDQPVDISLPVEAQIDAIYANAYMAECNQALADMYGMPSVEALIGMRLLDAHGGRDKPENRAAFRKFIEGGYKSTNDETMERGAHGNLVWFLSNTIGIVENGYLVRLWGTSVDITERKRMEAEIRDNEEQYVRLINLLPSGIVVHHQWKIAFANQAAQKIFGTSRPDQLIGTALLDRVHPDYRELVRERVRLVEERGQTAELVEEKLLRLDGTAFDAEVTANSTSFAGKLAVLTIFTDITERKRAEEERLTAAETFAAVFNSSPVGLIIGRDSDARIVDVNNAFTLLTGISRQEAIGHTAMELNLVSPEDRERNRQMRREQGFVRDLEIPMRRRTGETAIVLLSSEVIYLNGEKYVLTTLNDITARKQVEKIAQLRVRLWEYASMYSMEALMQRTLDDIGELTGSPIGFYHFVDEDQNTISLQAWSTRTLAEDFMLEGKGIHYPIAEAGVWVDCVRQRKPVIHNDNALLPHRKGFLEGHAELIRDLLVPTMRDSKVVSILGVGNKPSDYDEQDVELVTYIADVVWTIIEKKRADEQILQLNIQLERIAMMDDLTDLPNRRFFFLQGTKEINSVQRYHTPFSLLMLDVDKFKDVNDRHGHDGGDLVLRHVARILDANVRGADTAARLGGEEFGVLLPNTEAEDAVKLAERIRSAIEQEDCVIQNHSIKVTVSIGVSSYNGKDLTNLDVILRRADVALYRAKNAGRNQVVLLN